LTLGLALALPIVCATFVTPVRPVQNTTLQGRASGLTCEVIGTVRYIIRNDAGRDVPIIIHGVLHAPQCPSRLICPWQLLASTNDNTAEVAVCCDNIKLSFGGSTFTVPYHPRNNLPILHTTTLVDCYHAYCHANNFETHKHPSKDEAQHITFAFPPHTLSVAQRIKLCWHHQLNHVNFDQLTSLMKDSKIWYPLPSQTSQIRYVLSANSASQKGNLTQPTLD
jgi:hypothetical protein